MVNITLLRSMLEEQIAILDDEIQYLYEEKLLTFERGRYLLIMSDSDAKIRRLVSMSMMDVYLCIETILRLILEEFEEELPKGDHWHEKLLKLAVLETVRPGIITNELKKDLDWYRRFYHVLRNEYKSSLNLEGLKIAFQKMPVIVNRFKQEVRLFLNNVEIALEQQ